MVSSPTPTIYRSSPQYESLRTTRLWSQRHPQRYPLAIIPANSTQHVIDAVHLAAEHNARVAVRSGGHSWSAASVRDGSVLVDLENLQREMEWDEGTGVVSVAPATTSREVNEFLAQRGRMFAGGHCPDVALGGFLLQGGVGWNARVSFP